ncbi:amino acid adenylation domain-containing protein, partial [Pseudoalteromonas sp. J010]|uniref:non-ribosomal peptide synthetase n=1 Tax=Pseudoalteromonas sp. J010 TaxID=998465 RepID=UPI000F6527A5
MKKIMNFLNGLTKKGVDISSSDNSAQHEKGREEASKDTQGKASIAPSSDPVTPLSQHACQSTEYAKSHRDSVPTGYTKTAAEHSDNAQNEVKKFASDPALSSDLDKPSVLEDFNATAYPIPQGMCLHHLFIEQVKRSPDAIAVVDRGQAYSYQTLYERSQQFALYLQSQGVKPDTVVGLCLESSFDLIVSVWGVLMAGGAYLPLDPHYPPERLAYIVSDVKPQLIISRSDSVECIRSGIGDSDTLILLDKDLDVINAAIAQLQADAVSLNETVNANHLAYVLYTSGSTGKPKGVMVEHQSVVNHNLFAARAYQIDSSSVQIQLASIGFDIFVEEVLVIHNHGATLVLEDKQALLNIASLTEIVQRNQVNTLNLPTAFFHHLVIAEFDFSLVKTIIVGGEKLDHQKAKRCLTGFPNVQLINTYGPTETTVISSIQAVSLALLNEYDDIPIGQPIANTAIYICDEAGKPLPVGSAGELCIGGVGLARGYLNQPVLTASKFIENPFVSGERLYKTGDLACLTDDGKLTYLGRIDTQIKFNGYRIEPQEIEQCLNTCHGVKDSIVVLQKTPQYSRLVAFCLADEVPFTGAIATQHLETKLPSYMIPEHFVVLESFPTTPNGKIDRRALEAMELSITPAPQYIAPTSATEHQLVTIWAETFARPVEQVSTAERLGHTHVNSLQISLLQAKIRKAFQVNLPLAQFYQNNSLAELGRCIDTAETHQWLDIPALNHDQQAIQPSYAQQGLWLVEQLNPGHTAYSIPVAWHYQRKLNITALTSALEQLVARHASLRTTFPSVEGKAVQQVQEQVVLDFELYDVSHYDN